MFAIPATRIYDVVVDKRWREDLHVTAQLGVETAQMEHLDIQPLEWAVAVGALVCPCRVYCKYGCCVHILCALGTASSIDMSVRETLVYRGLTSACRRCKLANLRVDLEHMDLHFQRTNC
ncbi:hypothetical protein GQ600_14324 [Phytophthora cactorum]|nr:hypothetical protein GQ600_14324 [Phytophthora cactorum]